MPVLDTTGFWRCHFMWKTEQVRRADGHSRFATLSRASRGRRKIKDASRVTSTAPPAPGWTAPAFDDRTWARARGPFYTRATRKLAVLNVRGKFRVDDLAKAGPLQLGLVYRGGAVVYMNGTEVARGHLPAGALVPDSVAEPYPPAAYTNPDGELLRWVGFGDPDAYKDRFARRDRALTATVPAAMLRKGVNVLAIQVHRAPTDELLYTAKFKNAYRYSLWAMVGLIEVKLDGPAGAALTPNVARPPGVQAWVHPIDDSLHETDYGDPNESLQPLRLFACRNGVFSGQVAVSATQAISGLSATVSDLKNANGAVIPAAAVSVRYAVRGVTAEFGNEGRKPWDGGAAVRYPRGTLRFDGLLEKAPPELAVPEGKDGVVQPVWMTVRVPKDASAGEYHGMLRVSCAGRDPIEVNVELHVAGWTAPDPAEFVSHVGLIQSPHTLAIHYDVPMWSEKHWRLIERSLQWSGELGNDVLYVPVLRRTYFGNEHGMVRWVKKKDGTFDHDFSIVEKYVDLAVKHLGEPSVICFVCWELGTGSAYMTGKHNIVAKTGVPFTILDPGTGELSEGVGPKWGEEGSVPFWKPVLGGLHGLLEKRGLADVMMVGVTGDRRPGKDAVEDLKNALDIPWVCAAHNSPASIHSQPIGYRTVVWSVKLAPDPSVKRYYGWGIEDFIAVFPRYIATCMGRSLQLNSPLGIYRCAMEGALTANLRGVGRCGVDFWDVLKKKRGKTAPILGRYPENSNWHGGWLHNSFPYILWPGPGGPVGTVRFEVYREGIQEAEARVFLEKALRDPKQKAKLGWAVASRAQAVLDERVRAIRQAAEGMGTYPQWKWFSSGELQDRSKALFTVAAQAQAKLE